ncbi:hypothetical protein QRX50_23435 [Amycolatopsis carbonis]|uniref:Uncharacterized protein n=1 Tax=Amycolatopsis carbonis TaxID=715471 RepID=A0A9Y2N1Y8_9PSEU|nr:hypothetical protein [Amycolatopsis sp. 2-15]WIX83499.1 hypothetical protein QRX50_23435 [Amycolatopsis sp. 2-15]
MSARRLPDAHWPPGWGPEWCDSFVSHERYVSARIVDAFVRLAAVGDWPSWQQGVDRVEAAGVPAVGRPFVVVAAARTFDAFVGEFASPNRFGWAGVSEGLSFYQAWVLQAEPRGGTWIGFQEAARGPLALLQAASRAELTRRWCEAL